MLVHIVMMRIDKKFGADEKEKHLHTIKQVLEQLTEQIEPLMWMEVGLNVSQKSSAFDLVLTSHFADEDGLAYYRVHPAHMAVLDYMANTVSEVVAVDYLK